MPKMTEADVAEMERYYGNGNYIPPRDDVVALCREWLEQRAALISANDLRADLELQRIKVRGLVDDVCMWRSRAEAMEKWAEEVAKTSPSQLYGLVYVQLADILSRRPTWPKEPT